MQCHGADPLAQAASAPGDVMKQVRAPFLDRQVHQLTHLDSRHLSDAAPQRRRPRLRRRRRLRVVHAIRLPSALATAFSLALAATLGARDGARAAAWREA